MQAVVISPDDAERDIFTYTIRRSGVAVAASGDLSRYLSNWDDHAADIILIALGVDEKPETVTNQVRQVTQAPLLLLCERPTQQESMEALLAGADLVLARPVSPQILAAQITALLRRANMVPAFVLPTLQSNTLALEPSTRTITVGSSEPKRLTQLEFRLLYVLMSNPGHVLPTDLIVEKVWGYSGEGNRDLVRGLVSRLRKKIEPNPESPIFLETHSGIGYRFIHQAD